VGSIEGIFVDLMEDCENFWGYLGFEPVFLSINIKKSNKPPNPQSIHPDNTKTLLDSKNLQLYNLNNPQQSPLPAQ
jgi:hypothetical protein